MTLYEVYEIERVLVELEGLNDYTTMSIGTLSYNKETYENIKIKISEEKTACIMYKCVLESKEKIRIGGIFIE